MSQTYADFPGEYKQLVALLNNMEFEKAEQLLQRILQREPNHQRAKTDLEKVRGRLSAIKNYVFRVQAFVKEGDLSQAATVLAEAMGKFPKHPTIRKLAGWYKQQASKG